MDIELIILNNIAVHPGATILRIFELGDWPRGFTIRELKVHIDELIKKREIKVLKVGSNTLRDATLDFFFDKSYHIVSFS